MCWVWCNQQTLKLISIHLSYFPAINMVSLWWKVKHVMVEDPTQRCVLHQVHHLYFSRAVSICEVHRRRYQFPLSSERKSRIIQKWAY